LSCAPPQNLTRSSAEIHLGRLHYNGDIADGESESTGLGVVNE
jgi:hypothetical protein